jgi:outer membrane protein assembly factor BamB
MRLIQFRSRRAAPHWRLCLIVGCLLCISTGAGLASSPTPIINESRSYTQPPPVANSAFGFTGDISNKYVAILGYEGTESTATVWDAFIYDAVTGQFLRKLSQPVPASNNNFRFESIAIDGDLAVIGATFVDVPLAGGGTAFNAGAAYVYDLSTGQMKVKFVSNTPQNNADLGKSVDILGNRAVVSSLGNAYVFDANTGAQLARFAASGPLDDFGARVAISESAIVISADLYPMTSSYYGVARSYDPQTFAPIATFVPPVPAPGASFGSSLAIDGRYAIGGSGTSAYVFDVLTGVQLQSLILPGSATYTNSVDIQGTTALLGNPVLKQATTFDWTSGAALQNLVATDLASTLNYGWSVGLADGKVMVGSFGKAYQFQVVPEPPTMACGLAIAFLGCISRRVLRTANS